MMKKILKVLAVAQAVAFPSVNVQKADKPITGYQIYDGQYLSEILIGDIKHDYIGKEGYWNLGDFVGGNTNPHIVFNIEIHINSGGVVSESYIRFNNRGSALIDWEKSGLYHNPSYDEYPSIWSYPLNRTNFCLYLKQPVSVINTHTYTEKYLAYTSPAREFAAGFDGFIPSFYYTSISGNKSFLDSINSVSSLIRGNLWKSGDVSSLNIEKDGFIFQYYYVYASVEGEGREYDVWLRALAKSKDDKGVDMNISELVYVNLNENKHSFKSYDFPKPVASLETKQGYYDIIRSGGAYGLTESVYTYEEGYKDGQGNPTFKSFIVSAFEACSGFFALPVLGKNITVGTLIGSFVGLGALFLLIKLFM